MRRRKAGYFTQDGGPAPIVQKVSKAVSFSEVDAMAIVWHGRYVQYFEMAEEALLRRIGMSYAEHATSGVRSPIVQLHVDYHRPIGLTEVIEIEAKLVWDEAARMNTEFRILKQDGTLAATGYLIQMFVSAETGLPFLTDPPMFAEVRRRWLAGEFA